MQILIWLGYAIITIIAAIVGALIGAIFGLFIGPAQVFTWLNNGESTSSSIDDTI